MIFRTTLSLAKKLKLDLPADAATAGAPLLDWSANVFKVGRTQQILLVNTQSLYVALMPGAGMTSGVGFVEDALAAIGERMCRDGWTDAFRRYVLPGRERVQFSKTLGRSVTGSMNDHIVAAKLYLSDGLGKADVERRLNRTPLKANGYRFAVEVMAGMVEGAKVE
jgi:hypothetical protein